MDEKLIAATSGVIGAIIAGLVAVIVAKLNRKPADLTASAAAQNALNQSFEALAKEMRAAHLEQSAKIDELTERSEAQTEKITTLTGHIRSLAQHVLSLESILRSNGIDVPERPAVPDIEPWEPPTGAKIIRFQQRDED